jgi:hypothetical protein
MKNATVEMSLKSISILFQFSSHTPLLRNLGIPEEGDDSQPLTRIFNLGNS